MSLNPEVTLGAITATVVIAGANRLMNSQRFGGEIYCEQASRQMQSVQSHWQTHMHTDPNESSCCLAFDFKQRIPVKQIVRSDFIADHVKSRIERKNAKGLLDSVGSTIDFLCEQQRDRNSGYFNGAYPNDVLNLLLEELKRWLVSIAVLEGTEDELLVTLRRWKELLQALQNADTFHTIGDGLVIRILGRVEGRLEERVEPVIVKLRKAITLQGLLKNFSTSCEHLATNLTNFLFYVTRDVELGETKPDNADIRRMAFVLLEELKVAKNAEIVNSKVVSPANRTAMMILLSHLITHPSFDNFIELAPPHGAFVHPDVCATDGSASSSSTAPPSIKVAVVGQDRNANLDAHHRITVADLQGRNPFFSFVDNSAQVRPVVPATLAKFMENDQSLTPRANFTLPDLMQPDAFFGWEWNQPERVGVCHALSEYSEFKPLMSHLLLICGWSLELATLNNLLSSILNVTAEYMNQFLVNLSFEPIANALAMLDQKPAVNQGVAQPEPPLLQLLRSGLRILRHLAFHMRAAKAILNKCYFEALEKDKRTKWRALRNSWLRSCNLIVDDDLMSLMSKMEEMILSASAVAGAGTGHLAENQKLMAQQFRQFCQRPALGGTGAAPNAENQILVSAATPTKPAVAPVAAAPTEAELNIALPANHPLLNFTPPVEHYAETCQGCDVEFRDSVFNRSLPERKYCRGCGKSFCSDCTGPKSYLANPAFKCHKKPGRLCLSCRKGAKQHEIQYFKFLSSQTPASQGADPSSVPVQPVPQVQPSETPAAQGTAKVTPAGNAVVVKAEPAGSVGNDPSSIPVVKSPTLEILLSVADLRGDQPVILLLTDLFDDLAPFLQVFAGSQTELRPSPTPKTRFVRIGSVQFILAECFQDLWASGNQTEWPERVGARVSEAIAKACGAKIVASILIHNCHQQIYENRLHMILTASQKAHLLTFLCVKGSHLLSDAQNAVFLPKLSQFLSSIDIGLISLTNPSTICLPDGTEITTPDPVDCRHLRGDMIRNVLFGITRTELHRTFANNITISTGIEV